MSLLQSNRIEHRKWKMLFIYNIYRMVSIVALFFLFWFSAYSRNYYTYYNLTLLGYLLFGIVCFYLTHIPRLKFELQVIWSGTIDIIVIAIFINSIGHLESGLGILLYVSVAVLSILIPGRIAIYFASVASLSLLGINIGEYDSAFQQDLSPFFTTGIYGAGFFATALTTWYLASRVRTSESIAEQWSNELFSILRVGE